jgi:hypothetical protein
VRVGVAGDIERLCLFYGKSESVKGGNGGGKVHIPRMARLCISSISATPCSVDMVKVVGVVILRRRDWDGMAKECLGDVAWQYGERERELCGDEYSCVLSGRTRLFRVQREFSVESLIFSTGEKRSAG